MKIADALLLSAVAFFCVAAYLYVPESTQLYQGDIAIIIGSLTLFGSLWIKRRSLHEQVVAHERHEVRPYHPVHYSLIIISAFCLLLLAERNGYMLEMRWMVFWIDIHGQFLLFIIGILCGLIGIAGLYPSDLNIIPRILKQHRREFLLVGLVTLIAYCLRWWQIENLVRTLMDEGPFLYRVVTLRHHTANPILHPISGVATFPHIYPYLQLLSAELFGSTIASFRLVSVLFGTLTIPPLYWLARQLFDRQIALVSSIFLATFPPHIHMSRNGINNIADPLPGVLAIACLVAAIQTKKKLYYVLAGIFYGLLPYFYEGGELLYGALIPIWIIWMVLVGGMKPNWGDIGRMLGIAMMIVFPVYYTNAMIDVPAFSRLSDAGLPDNILYYLLATENGAEQLQFYFRDFLLPPILHYFHAPDGSLFYGGETPLILSMFVPLFFLGVGYAIWHIRQWGALFIGWIALTALGNSLVFIFNAWTARFVVAMPAVTLLMAVGLVITWRLLIKIPSNSSEIYIKRMRLQMMLLVIIIAGWQVSYYFNQHIPFYNQQVGKLYGFYDAVFRASDENNRGTTIYFIYDDYTQGQYTEPFFLYKDRGLSFLMLESHLFDPATLDMNQDYAFYIRERDLSVLQKLDTYWHLDGPYYTWDTRIPRHERLLLYRATVGNRRPLE